MHQFRRHLTSAHAIALIALIVALSGSAYAAVSLPRDSVGTRQLRTGAVTKSKISKRTRAALHGARGSRGKTGHAGATGPKGPIGPTGARGGAGAAGTTGPSDLYAAGNSGVNLSHTNTTVASVTVPAGSYVLEATVNVNASPKGEIGCSIETTGTTYDGKAVDPAADGANEVIALSGAATFTTPQTLRLDCSTFSTSAFAGNARLFAIKTGRIHATLPLPTGL